jgi:hypothetical protein
MLKLGKDRYWDVSDLDFMRSDEGFTDFEGFSDADEIKALFDKAAEESGFSRTSGITKDGEDGEKRFEYIQDMVYHYIQLEMDEGIGAPSLERVIGAIWGLWAATESRWMMKSSAK